jgi:hypothetical protein
MVMGPARHGTKNDSTCEGQQQLTEIPNIRRIKVQFYDSAVFMRAKNVVMSPTGRGTNDDCFDKGQ